MFKRPDIFELAIHQVEREGKIARKDWRVIVIERAIRIRKWLDIQDKNLKSAETKRRNKNNKESLK